MQEDCKKSINEAVEKYENDLIKKISLLGYNKRKERQ